MGQFTKMATFTCRKLWNLKSSQLYLKLLNSLLNYLKCWDMFFAELKIRHFFCNLSFPSHGQCQFLEICPLRYLHTKSTFDQLEIFHLNVFYFYLFETHNWLDIFHLNFKNISSNFYQEDFVFRRGHFTLILIT